MSDNMIEALEDKVMMLVSEMENLRKELNHLRQENSTLKNEKANSMKKLQGLVSLMDTLKTMDLPDASDVALESERVEF